MNKANIGSKIMCCVLCYFIITISSIYLVNQRHNKKSITIFPISQVVKYKNIDFSQKTKYTCGPAALRYILYYYGIDVAEDKLVEMMSVDNNGTSLLEIVKTVELFGLQGVGYKTDIGFLRSYKKPSIAYIGKKHFVVIKKIKGNYIYVYDPLSRFGNVKLPINKFIKVWDGIVLIIKTKPIDFKGPNC